MLFVTIFIAVFYIWLLRYIAKPLLYVSMVLVVALFAGTGVYSW